MIQKFSEASYYPPEEEFEHILKAYNREAVQQIGRVLTPHELTFMYALDQDAHPDLHPEIAPAIDAFFDENSPVYDKARERMLIHLLDPLGLAEPLEDGRTTELLMGIRHAVTHNGDLVDRMQGYADRSPFKDGAYLRFVQDTLNSEHSS